MAPSAAMESVTTGEASAPVAEPPASACQSFRRILTNPDGRCFFRAIAIGKNQELQYADRNSDQLILDIRMRLREINMADALRSNMIMHIVDNIDLYKDIASWAASADLPLGKSYTSIEERVASSAKPTEMVGELEILAMSRTLRQQIHIVVGDSTLRYGEEFPRSNVLMVLYVSLAADVGHFDALVPPTRSSCTATVTPARGSPFTKAAKPKGHARTTKSEDSSSSPYNENMTCNKAKTKPNKTKCGAAKKNQSQTKTKSKDSKRPKRQQRQHGINAEGDQADDSDSDPWYCVLCDEERKETMIRCKLCETWIHQSCAGGIPPNFRYDRCE